MAYPCVFSPLSPEGTDARVRPPRCLPLLVSAKWEGLVDSLTAAALLERFAFIGIMYRRCGPAWGLEHANADTAGTSAAADITRQKNDDERSGGRRLREDPAKYSHVALRHLLQRGYAVYPVNPKGGAILGQTVYRSVSEIPMERLDRVVVYVPPEVGLQILPEIAAKGCNELWLNPGSESPELVSHTRGPRIECDSGLHDRGHAIQIGVGICDQWQSGESSNMVSADEGRFFSQSGRVTEARAHTASEFPSRFGVLRLSECVLRAKGPPVCIVQAAGIGRTTERSGFMGTGGDHHEGREEHEDIHRIGRHQDGAAGQFQLDETGKTVSTDTSSGFFVLFVSFVVLSANRARGSLQPACRCQIQVPDFPRIAQFGRLQPGVARVPREEAMTIAEPESPRPHRRLNCRRHEVPT